MLQKSMPKLNEKTDAILEGIVSESATGWRASRSQQTELRSDQEQEFQEGVQLGVRQWGAPDCNRFASPASPGVWLMCAELMLAELTMLLLAGLNSFPGSDIIEHKLYGKSPIFHIPFSKLA